MYFGVSIVGKALTIRIEISYTLSLNFTGGQKVQNLASFKTSLKFYPPAFENAARYPNSETKVQCCDDRPMSWPSLVTLGLPTPKQALSVLTHPYNCTRKRAKSSITRPAVNYLISLKTEFKHMTPEMR